MLSVRVDTVNCLSFATFEARLEPAPSSNRVEILKSCIEFGAIAALVSSLAVPVAEMDAPEPMFDSGCDASGLYVCMADIRVAVRLKQ